MILIIIINIITNNKSDFIEQGDLLSFKKHYIKINLYILTLKKLIKCIC